MSQKLFFLHIPKTGGESVNRVLGESIGPGVLHAESYRSRSFAGLLTGGYRFISGHLTNYEARSLLGAEFRFATVVRKPEEHLISHIGWALHLNEPQNETRLRRHSSEVRQLCGYLRSYNLSEASSFERFVKDLPDVGHLFFNNCQTRYVSNRPNKLQYTENDGKAAASDLYAFDCIGLFHDLESFVGSVGELVGSPMRLGSVKENVLGNRFGIGQFEAFPELVDPLVCADKILYEAAKDLSQERV